MQETLFTIGAGPVDMYPEVRAAFVAAVDSNSMHFREVAGAVASRSARRRARSGEPGS